MRRMASPFRKQPASPNLDALFLRMEAERVDRPADLEHPLLGTPAVTPPAAGAELDVRSLAKKFPLTEAERLRIFQQNVWSVFAITFVSAVEGNIVTPSMALYTHSLGGDDQGC
jgi:hypothetical protein